MIITNRKSMIVSSQDVYVHRLDDGYLEVHTLLSNWLDLFPYPRRNAAVLLMAGILVIGVFVPFSFTKRKEDWLFKGTFERSEVRH